jgi:hypothetical protein
MNPVKFLLIVAFVFTPCFGYLKVWEEWAQRASVRSADRGIPPPRWLGRILISCRCSTF